MIPERFAEAQRHGDEALRKAIAAWAHGGRPLYLEEAIREAVSYVVWEQLRLALAERAGQGYATRRLRYTLRLRERLPGSSSNALGLFQMVAIDRIVLRLVLAYVLGTGEEKRGALLAQPLVRERLVELVEAALETKPGAQAA